MGLFRRSRVESWQPEARGHKPKSPKKTRSDVPVEKMSDSALRKLDGALQPTNAFMRSVIKHSDGKGHFVGENFYIKMSTAKVRDSDDLTPREQAVMDEALRHKPPIKFNPKGCGEDYRRGSPL